MLNKAKDVYSLKKHHLLQEIYGYYKQFSGTNKNQHDIGFDKSIVISILCVRLGRNRCRTFPMSTPLPCWYLYVVLTEDHLLYTGISTDVRRRFREHQARGSKTAKYLFAHKPRCLAFSHPVGDRSLAMKVEYHFKRLSKKEKKRIIASHKLVFDPDSGKILVRG